MEDMFSFHCPHCNVDRLASTRDIISMHRNADGRLAYVRCPNGHTVVRQFHRPAPRYPAPVAPAAPTTTTPVVAACA